MLSIVVVLCYRKKRLYAISPKLQLQCLEMAWIRTHVTTSGCGQTMFAARRKRNRTWGRLFTRFVHKCQLRCWARSYQSFVHHRPPNILSGFSAGRTLARIVGRNWIFHWHVTVETFKRLILQLILKVMDGW